MAVVAAREMFPFWVAEFVVLFSYALAVDHLEVTTTYGAVRGESVETNGRAVYSFTGIPYTESIRNFEPAEQVQPWASTLDATKLPPLCSGVTTSLLDVKLANRTYDTSEQWLYLNVYTPSIPGRKHSTPSKAEQLIYGNAPYPVLVYFANEVLGATFPAHTLVARERVLVVTVNYRVNCFGYLCAGEAANLALLDQRLALRWLQEVLPSFHGDKSRVTLFGAGRSAVDVNAHLLSPASDGLYARAWMSSDSLLSPGAISTTSKQSAERFLDSVTCGNKTSAETLTCLRERTTEELLVAAGDGGSWSLCVDGVTLEDLPVQMYWEKRWNHRADVMIGFAEFDKHDPQVKDITLAELRYSVERLLTELGVSLSARQYALDDLTDLYLKDAIAPWDVTLAEISSDIRTVTPLLTLADYHSNNTKDEDGWGLTFVYEFSYRGSSSDTPEQPNAVRGDDLVYLFGFPCSELISEEAAATFNAKDCLMSQQLMTRLANFMRNADPNSVTTVAVWPEYKPDARKLLSAVDPSFSRISSDYKRERVAYWARLLFPEQRAQRAKKKVRDEL